MYLLIIGYSSLARRRLIPAALQSADISMIDAASLSRFGDVVLPEPKGGEVFGDYEKALKKSRASLVWISLINSGHAEWAELALLSGRHVIVDKPAFLSLSETERLNNLAQKKRLLLAEATVWPCHPLMRKVEEAVLRHGKPNQASAVFTFPPFPSGDFRYKKNLGGGMLNDLGPYAVSVNRVVFGLPPQTTACWITSTGDEVETGFECRLEREGRIVKGVFGFAPLYENRLTVQGDDWSVELEPAFTSPPGKPGRIVEQSDGKEIVHPAPDGDAFSAFLNEITEAIQKRQYDAFARKLMNDAEMLEILRRAAEKG